MKTTLITTATLAALALPAFAQDAVVLDADEDGLITLEEAQAVYPEVSEDDFTAADKDGDGALNADEVTMARADGLLPMAEEG